MSTIITADGHTVTQCFPVRGIKSPTPERQAPAWAREWASEAAYEIHDQRGNLVAYGMPPKMRERFVADLAVVLAVYGEP